MAESGPLQLLNNSDFAKSLVCPGLGTNFEQKKCTFRVWAEIEDERLRRKIADN